MIKLKNKSLLMVLIIILLTWGSSPNIFLLKNNIKAEAIGLAVTEDFQSYSIDTASSGRVIGDWVIKTLDVSGNDTAGQVNISQSVHDSNNKVLDIVGGTQVQFKKATNFKLNSFKISNKSTVGGLYQVEGYRTGVGVPVFSQSFNLSDGQFVTVDTLNVIWSKIDEFRISRTDAQPLNLAIDDINIEPPINIHPSVTISGGKTEFTRGSPPVVVDPGLTIQDPDNFTLASATITIDNFYSNQDTLTFISNPLTMGNISGVFDSSIGRVTLTSEGATATINQWQSALRSVTYNNNSNTPNLVDRAVSFVVNDGIISSFSIVKSIHIVGLSNNADLNNLVVSEGNITPAFSPNETNYTVELGKSKNNSLQITPTLADSNAKVLINNQPSLGPVTIFDGSNIIEIKVTAPDGITSKTYRITVNRDFLPPSITPTTTKEDTQSSGGLVLSLNGSSTAMYFKITDIKGGTLYKSNGSTQIAEHQFITVAEGNAGLKFTPNSDTNSTDGQTLFGFNVQSSGDLSGTGLSDPVGAIITVSEVNDAPTAVNDSLDPIFADSGEQQIPVAKLLGNDVAGPANESNQTIKVIGVFNGIGCTVTMNNSGDLVYFLPDQQFTGMASFQYTIIDDGTTQGVSTPLTSNATVSFEIKPSTNANLSGLTSNGLSIEFNPNKLNYTGSVAHDISNLKINPTVAFPSATVVVEEAENGSVPLNVGNNTIHVKVTAQDRVTTKTYTITVTRAFPDVTIGYASGDSETSVTQNLTLPTKVSDLDVQWASDNVNVLAANGIVNRPSYTQGNQSVTLTATISKGNVSKTQVFPVTVIKLPETDEEAVSFAKGALDIGYAPGDSLSNVTQNVSLITAGAHGTSITWTTDKANFIAADGTVTRPTFTQGTQDVALTAVIKKGAKTDTKLFTLKVIALAQTYAEAVANAKSALAIGYATGDSQNNVTQSVTLPITGPDGTTIAWVSDKASVIATDGTVTRPSLGQGDQTVTLTATITKGSETDTRTFTLTVMEKVASTNANLSSLTLSTGTLSQAFDKNTNTYTVNVSNSVSSITFSPVVEDTGKAVVTVNNQLPTTSIPLNVGDNTITVVVTAEDGVTTKTYTITVKRAQPSSGGGGGGSTPPQPEPPNSEIITVPIEAGDQTGSTVSSATIKRTTGPNGMKKDDVSLTPENAVETVRKLKEAGADTARIVIPDAKDEVAEVNVSVNKEAIQAFQQGAINLEIYTENARIVVPKDSVNEISNDLYFRVIPIKEERKKDEVKDRAKQQEVVRKVAGSLNINVVGRPMTIETNMPNQPVDLILPLKGVTIPTEAKEREDFFNKLGVFIEHSDGEKVFIKGEVVPYKNGELGLKFTINKFSTFTIINMEQGWKEPNFNDQFTGRTSEFELPVMVDKVWNIKFNQAVKSSTVNNETVYMYDQNGGKVEIDIQLINNDHTITVSPKTYYKPNTKYYLYLSENIESSNGKRFGTSERYVFKTTSYSLEAGKWQEKNNISPNKEWTITFNANVNQTLLTDNYIFVTDQYGRKVDVNIEMINSKTIKIKPVKPYNLEQTYYLFMKDLESDKNIKMKNLTWMKFTVGTEFE